MTATAYKQKKFSSAELASERETAGFVWQQWVEFCAENSRCTVYDVNHLL